MRSTSICLCTREHTLRTRSELRELAKSVQTSPFPYHLRESSCFYSKVRLLYREVPVSSWWFDGKFMEQQGCYIAITNSVAILRFAFKDSVLMKVIMAKFDSAAEEFLSLLQC